MPWQEADDDLNICHASLLVLEKASSVIVMNRVFPSMRMFARVMSMRRSIHRWAVGLVAFTVNMQGFAEQVVFSHQGALYHSITDGKQPGLFVYEKSKQKGASDFLPPKRIGDAVQGLTVALSDGKIHLVSPGCEHTLDPEKGLVLKRKIQLPGSPPSPSLWTLADYNGDGHTDVIVFSQTAADAKARIFYGRADGSHADAFVLRADGKDFDSSGIRSPHFVNLDDDDDLDLICLDAGGRIIYYENSNTNSEPLYAAGRILVADALRSMTPFDWDRDSLPDLMVETKEGKIGWMKQSARAKEGPPVFTQPDFLVP